MKTIAVIAEYNPFHLGHLDQLKEIRHLEGGDARVIIVMSGNFVQRGEPAILSREQRAKQALAAGASLILELPTAFATASAGDFAKGAVRLIQATGVCRHIYCGSENTEDPEFFSQIVEELANPGSAYQAHLRDFLDQGLHYAAARESALAKIWPDKEQEVHAFLHGANNILALEYALAIEECNQVCASPYEKLFLHRLPRKGNDRDLYLDTDRQAQETVFASATSIRRLVTQDSGLSKRFLALENLVPPISLAHLTQVSGPVPHQKFTEHATLALQSLSPDVLNRYRYFEDGLSQRCIKTAHEIAGQGLRLEDLWEKASTRYYPMTRIQRAVLSYFLGIDKDTWNEIQEDGPAFVRVLGFDKDGRYLLKLMRRLCPLAKVNKESDLLEVLPGNIPSMKAQQELQLRADRLYNLLSCTGRTNGSSSGIFDTHSNFS